MMKRFSAGALALALSLAPSARAFCGFYISGADTKLYNNATQVVLMREGTRTVLTMQNNYQGPPSAFAMVVPVPVILQKENVKTLDRKVFDKIDQLDSPRLVEYWEQDPCAPPYDDEDKKAYAPSAVDRAEVRKKGAGDFGVTVEAQFTVGEYEVVILSAKDSTGLDGYLRQEKYAIPAGAEPFLKPYVAAGSKFFVAKVDPKKVTFDDKGMATLSPLRFHYDATEFSLPIRLGLINAKDAQDLIVHVLARGQRYEVANYPNVTIPTNIDVGENAKGQFSTFYASLFDATLRKNPGSVITEYSWDASTCDPCPGPTLDGSDFATFGADVLGPPAAGDAPMRKGRGFWGGGAFTLTRLHARYSKDNLGADLVFKAAPPIMGGREVMTAPGQIEHGAQPAGTNNFQGRYVIRHAWTGPIACPNPQRGIWGGPPAGVAVQGGSQPKAARNLAFATRGADLATFVKGSVPELAGLPALPPSADAGAPEVDAGAAIPAVPPKGGCAGCSEAGGVQGLGAFGVMGLAMLALRRRRR